MSEIKDVISLMMIVQNGDEEKIQMYQNPTMKSSRKKTDVFVEKHVMLEHKNQTVGR